MSAGGNPGVPLRVSLHGVFVPPDADLRIAVDGLVRALAESDRDEVNVDLEDVSLLTLEGVGVLIAFQRHAQRSGVRMRLVGVSSQACETLETTGVAGLFR